MTELANANLLRTALGERTDDPVGAARERLRTSHLHFKERATQLASEIARSFPDLTVHDGTHLDAVWEMADLAAGEAIELNALEAYVLGGAILLHDLGLAVAAYPDPDALRREPRWSDAIAVVLEERLGRTPRRAEIAAADTDTVRAAQELLLRQLHAEQAEELALVHWPDDRGEAQYLIEDGELRRAIGAVIGQLAHSHWWPTDELARQFDGRLGPPPWCPPEWTVDLLKLACLLRVADALHLDARRAPIFLRAVRRPSDRSADHWSFQERLNRPFASGDRVVFTAGDRFGPADSRAWWLCYETLRDADRWMREVDALLSDLRRTRLRLHGVVGVDHPQRLATHVRTTGWTPVDTHIQISNVAGLVAKLGGRELYGDDSTVALRELIQNGADAVRARRRLQNRAADWGTVTVRIGTDEDGDWIEVEDEGVGMSQHVLTKGLLDFGTSYWVSHDLPAEFPGLLAGGFEPVGQYGIGFFSVFMLGSRVRVTTRPYRAAEADTQVLTFDGLDERPLLRPAEEDERLPEGGTRVRVWVDEPEIERLLTRRPHIQWSLFELCAHLCPALDVEVHVEGSNGGIASIDPGWQTMEPAELVGRVQITPQMGDVGKNIDPYVANLRPIHADGELVARLAVYPARDHYWEHEAPGVIAVGGLRACEFFGIMGVSSGTSLTASRDDAVPLVPEEALRVWASEQTRLIVAMGLDPERQRECAHIIERCGGDTGPLLLAESHDGWLDAAAIGAWAAELEEIIVVHGATLSDERRLRGAFEALPNVLAIDLRWSAIVQGSGGVSFIWPTFDAQEDFSALPGSIMRTISAVWDVPIRRLAKQTRKMDPDSVPVVIGTRDGREVLQPHAYIVRRHPAADDRETAAY